LYAVETLSGEACEGALSALVVPPNTVAVKRNKQIDENRSALKFLIFMIF
jgi:hypothetical protein